MFHENSRDDAELLVNPRLLPQLSDGGYVEVWKHNKPAGDPPREHRVVLQVPRFPKHAKRYICTRKRLL